MIFQVTLIIDLMLSGVSLVSYYNNPVNLY